MTFSTNEFKSGLKVIIEGEPYSIIENEFVKPGKGQAFNRVKLRNLKTQYVIEKTFKSGETLEGADILELEVQYLYQDETFWYFMSLENFEQYPVDVAIVGEAKLWLKKQDNCILVLWDKEGYKQALQVTVPNHVILKVIDTDPGLRGDTAGGGSKPATLETGAVVQVPLFIKIGDVLKVDTRTQEYIGRVKE